jgi:hypothetical protein
MEMGMKGKEEEGTRKCDNMGLVPINLKANGVTGHCKMNGLVCHHQVL